MHRVGIAIPPHGDCNFFHADVRGICGDSCLAAERGEISQGVIVFGYPLKAGHFMMSVT